MLNKLLRRKVLLLGLIVLLLALAACNQERSTSGAEATTGTEAPTASAETAVTPPSSPADPADSDQVDSTTPADLTQSAEAGAVTVQVTPLTLQEPQATALDFQIVMDTHSVDLGMDLAQTAVLRIGDQEIAANAWQAPAGGGHHVEGTLSFPAIDDSGRRWLEGATAVTLIIRDLAGIAERSFTWDLNMIARAGAMPMAGMAGQDMMGQMGMMQGMMDEMGDMPMGERQQMMGQMMGMMQGMMGQMDGMPVAEHQQMMGQMMGMMQGMMGMIADMPLEQRQEMMSQMMGMMQDMMTMMPGTASDMGDGMMTMPGMEHDMMGMSGMDDDHMAPIPSAGVPDATQTVGGQPLAFREEDGVKVFELVAAPVRWTILDDESEKVVVTAWAYNGTVPGPMIRVTEGESVRIILRNDLPEPTSIHWHGIPLPNAMDGVPPLTQAAVEPGDSFTYEFVAPPAGSFMYHSHVDTDRQIMVGLYAPFIVDPAAAEIDPPDVDVMWMLSEWRVGPDGGTYAAMPMSGAEPNYFTINGKAFPDTEPIVVKMGERVRIRLANIGQFTHPMHLHGINFRIVAYDGVSLSPEQQIVRNTIPVNPGELIDIEFVADNPGIWVFHCHVLHHVTNDNVEPGGLIGVIQVEE